MVGLGRMFLLTAPMTHKHRSQLSIRAVKDHGLACVQPAQRGQVTDLGGNVCPVAPAAATLSPGLGRGVMGSRLKILPTGGTLHWPDPDGCDHRIRDGEPAPLPAR